MSIWQFMDVNGLPTKDPQFDDGIMATPGNEGFSTATVTAAIPPGAKSFNYIGLSQVTQTEEDNGLQS
jgi:hypothetical protein